MTKSVLPDRTVASPHLEARLAHLVEQVRAQRLDRPEAAALLRTEVVQALGLPRRRDEMKLLCEAHLLRAIFLLSGPRIDHEGAAEALRRAADLDAELPPSPRRTHALETTARKLRVFLHHEERFDLLVPVMELLLVTWTNRPPENAVLRRAFAQLPRIVHRLHGEGGDPGLRGLLQEARNFVGVPGIPGKLRELESAAAQLWVHERMPQRVLEIERYPELLSAEQDLDLARELAERGLLDRRATEQYFRVLAGEREAVRDLEAPLSRLAHVGLESRAAELPARERMNEGLIRFYETRAWPYLNLAVSAARRGEDERAVAAFLVGLELGGSAEAAFPVLVASLAALGFDRTAEALLSEAAPTLNDVVVREVVATLLEARELVAAETPDDGRARTLIAFLDELAHPLMLIPGLAVRLQRVRATLCRAVGETTEALHALERASCLRPADPDLTIELAETAVDLGRVARARALLGILRERRGRSGLLLEARLAEMKGEPATALSLYETAYDESPARARHERLAARMKAILEAHASFDGHGRADSPLCRRMLEEVELARAERIPEAREGLLHAADLAHRLGECSREAALLERVVGPTAEVRKRLARCLLRTGAGRAALDALAPLSGAARDDEAHFLALLAAVLEGRLTAARERLQRLDLPGPTKPLLEAFIALASGDEALARQRLEDLPEGLPRRFEELADLLRRPLGLPRRSPSPQRRTPRRARRRPDPPVPAGENTEERLEARLLEVRRGSGPVADRREELESIYSAAVAHGFHGIAQRTLETLRGLKGATRTARSEERLALVRARLEAGRHGSVIALTGGARPDENLPLEALLHRVRALAALDGLTRARREFGRLRFLARDDEEAVPLVIAGHRELVFARIRREGSPGHRETLDRLDGDDADEAEAAAERLARREARDPLARWLHVEAAARRGAAGEALERARAAMRVAELAGDPEIRELGRLFAMHHGVESL